MVGLKRYIVALPVVVFYLIFASHVDASNNFCVTAVDKDLCEKTVKGATNWDEAVIKAIKVAMHVRTNASESVNPVCEMPYIVTQENLMESLETMEMARGGNKVVSLNIQLGAALNSLQDCTNALKHLKQDTTATKTLNHGVEQAIRVCMAVTASKLADSPSNSPNSNTSPSYPIRGRKLARVGRPIY